MIKISREFMNPSVYFVENGFTEAKFEEVNSFYFVSSSNSNNNEHDCVKIEAVNDNYSKVTPVKVYTFITEDSKEVIQAEDILKGKSSVDVLVDFFRYIEYANSTQDVIMFEDILNLVYWDYANCYSEKTELFADFGTIRIKGTAEEGAYNSLILNNVMAYNSSTNQPIKYFDKINLAAGLFDVADDDYPVESLVESYLESLSESEIKDIFSKNITLGTLD